MTQIIVDPAELRTFAAALDELAGDIRHRRLELEHATIEMRDYWDDEKYKKFKREQEQLLLLVQSFENRSAAYCEYIRMKARLAEAYLES